MRLTVPICPECSNLVRYCSSCSEPFFAHPLDLAVRVHCSNCERARSIPARTSSEDFFNDYSSEWRGILNHSTKPRYWPSVFSDSEMLGGKPPHNTRLFGLEIEVNYRCGHEQIWETCRQYMPGAFIMKHDGSLSTGSEIVIAPHSLEALRVKLNLRGLLRGLVARGARAYESGQCGLHIHVPWPGEGSAEKITAFFVANREKIRIFSKRSEESLTRWANIRKTRWERFAERPYSPSMRYVERGNKYISVNPHGDTLEFRCFRGTLNYKRVRASIEFVDALCSHVEETSLATLGSTRSWDSFLKYLDSRARYRGLLTYLHQPSVFGSSGVPRTEVEPGAGTEVSKLKFDSVPLESYVSCLVPEIVPSPRRSTGRSTTVTSPEIGADALQGLVRAIVVVALGRQSSASVNVPANGPIAIFREYARLTSRHGIELNFARNDFSDSYRVGASRGILWTNEERALECLYRMLPVDLIQDTIREVREGNVTRGVVEQEEFGQSRSGQGQIFEYGSGSLHEALVRGVVKVLELGLRSTITVRGHYLGAVDALVTQVERGFGDFGLTVSITNQMDGHTRIEIGRNMPNSFIRTERASAYRKLESMFGADVIAQVLREYELVSFDGGRFLGPRPSSPAPSMGAFDDIVEAFDDTPPF